MEKEIKSEKKNKPVHDEETLGNLLEAAYVLQEHNRLKREARPQTEVQPRREPARPLEAPEFQPEELSLPPLPPVAAAAEISATKITATEPTKDDYTPTLARIVEAQHEIQLHHLELNEALSLVAERLAKIAQAGGAAVVIVDGQKAAYRAVAGSMALPLGAEITFGKALSAASLKTGHVIRCRHVNTEFLIDPEECRRRGIRSLISVPVYHEGGIAGALEVYYSKSEGFTEQDVHTCQLMAGLITEALARADELHWKKSLADERAVMVQALEKLKPNLAALLDAPSAPKSSLKSDETLKGATASRPPKQASGVAVAAARAAESTFTCPKCGHQIVGDEQFCGKCGLPRSDDYEPPSMQSKVASLWQMQEASRKKPNSADVEEELALISPVQLSAAGSADNILEAKDAAGTSEASSTERPAKIERVADWSSAASARDFLEQLTSPSGGLSSLWQNRRGDVYLAVAVMILMICALWGVFSSRSVVASGSAGAAATHRKASPDAGLSVFDRMLISLGLAEAPEQPESKGNPNTQVWVDLQTALYYCPGTDLYGKTPRGRFSSQRDAQLDQFEPASRKVCN
jgi:putative methionine-R-sulfoxide reductase with GAF domain/predicted RNA-binding Zn-ribbon protein involved in translation (DUF1610 family)